ncbi:hypothetical protein TeGR_g2527 [Tetraparma gracilis]|uniref:COP9 signalosome complex subunit 2 n=1 Tax=Tetraparma gracilis TaxID=2962635 RepID=A0ABQ6N7B4_9STRA|nr:hypothetical protein TeGR_g2527 [Tetraparma gracilis]
MSDDDSYEYNDGSDEEEYDFQYSDEDANEEAGDADAENQYYNAKALREDDAGKARDAFEKVLEQEQKAERSVWGFKCLKQLIKLHRKSSDDKSMLECYGRLLGYISGGAVTQNEAEKGINGILDRLDPKAGMHEVYSRTLAAFAAGGAAPNPRLWFKCSLKLGQLLLDLNDVPRFAQTVEALLAAAEEADREGNGGTTLMEIYCLQIQMYSKTRSVPRLKELYGKAVRLQNNVPHPRTLGIIQECGGKMYMSERQ